MTAPSPLQKLGQRPSVVAYVRSIWQRRDFAVQIAVGEVRSQNMDTVLGNVWHVLNPLLLVGIYYLVFGVILGTDRGVDNFLPFLAVGVFSFHYTQKSVLAAGKSVANNLGLIRSIQFPRAVLPISTVLGHTFSFLPAIGVMLVIALLTGEPIRLAWLALIPIFLAQTLLNVGMGFVAARLTDLFRDVQNVLPFLFRLAFYMSGVIYLVDRRFIERELILAFFDVNPFYAYLTLARVPVLGDPLQPKLILTAAIWTAVFFVGGFFFFRAAEHRYGRG